MYQRTRIILDWTVVLAIYGLILLIIPVSDKLLGHLSADTVDIFLNIIINVLIGSVFISLSVYLVKRGTKTKASSYIWLLVFFIITASFLTKVKITTDKLHFLGYGILSLFLYRALRHNIGTKMLYVYSGIFIMLFAILDEALQIFGLGGRSFEFKDIGIDWLSGLTGEFLIALVVKPKLEAVGIKIRRYIKGLKELKSFEVSRPPKSERLNFDRLAEQICLVFEKNTGHSNGHVHFIYKGKRDHLIFVCHNQRLEEIIAKGRHCKKRQFISWNHSEFCHLSPREAFLEFLPKIRSIIIDSPSLRKSWNSFNEFQNWLNQSAV